MPTPDSRRTFLRTAAAALTAAALAFPAAPRADDSPVPPTLQVELLFAVAARDRNLAARGEGQVRTLVVAHAADGAPRVAAFQAAAAGKAQVAGLPHAVELVTFSTPAALADTCRARRAGIVYLGPGFTAAEAAAIGQALAGVSVLSAAASPELVKNGVVLGFDLVSGRARLLLHAPQAERQRVSFSPEVLGLMVVSR